MVRRYSEVGQYLRAAHDLGIVRTKMSWGAAEQRAQFKDNFVTTAVPVGSEECDQRTAGHLDLDTALRKTTDGRNEIAEIASTTFIEVIRLAIQSDSGCQRDSRSGLRQHLR